MEKIAALIVRCSNAMRFPPFEKPDWTAETQKKTMEEKDFD
ncbi:MAG TPA: hypothetical protein VHX86_09860 [Tepidisphaeraceae bacterium]|nr:hypothetical protein [Tepidisphaeraceae bacterium]